MHTPLQDRSRGGPAPAARLAGRRTSGGTADTAGPVADHAHAAVLGEAAQRANAGPHAASLAGLQSVVAQRACADCEHVRRAMGGADPVQRAAANRNGLPEGLRAGLESLSGRDLSGVTVHYASPRPAQLNAHAFAQGSEIHVAPGQERHLPHEGWHAVQQLQNRVRPTMELGGTPVNDDAGLEREADVMGAWALATGGAAQRAERGDRGTRPPPAARTRAVQLNGEGEIDRSGKQDNIQKKMAQLVKMYSHSLGHGVESPWATDVILNGLCGGWVEIFKKYPAWIGELWAALKDWQVPDDWENGDPRPLLDALNHLIEQYATEASGIGSMQGQEAYLQVIQLLREAWAHMAVLEPDAGYDLDARPAFTEGIQTGLGAPAALVLQATIPATETSTPAEYTADAIRSYTGEQLAMREAVELVAHVETDEHHMAVRVSATADTLSITVVETENLGIATLSSWDELPAYLARGFFLRGDPTQTEEEVEIRLYAPPV